MKAKPGQSIARATSSQPQQSAELSPAAAQPSVQLDPPADDTPLPSGAGPSGPRNAPFETMAELSLVLGAERLPSALLDALTVHAHATAVQQRAAQPSVERALRWAEAQPLGRHSWLSPKSSGQAEQVAALSLAGQAVRVQACLEAVRQPAYRLAIVRLTSSAQVPVQVLQWQSFYP